MPRRCTTAWIVALLVGLAVSASPIAESPAAAAGVAGSPTASNNVTKWANIANAYSASDGAAAAAWNGASSCWNGFFWYTCASTSTVNFTTFGFDSSVPAGLTNLSATLELRTALTYLNLFASGAISMQAQVWNGSSWVNTGSSTYRNSYGAFNTYYTDSVTVTGLTSSQLSDSNFRVAVNGSSNGVGFGMLMDYVRVTVQDATAPTAGAVADGASTDVDWQTSTSSIQANWSGFSDSWPGIASYDYAIGTTAGGTQVKNWTSVGTATSVTASSLALSDGTTYFVSVRATDSDGNVSSVATSDGVTVDTTAPTPGTVNDGTTSDITWQNSTSTIQANWSGFSDATSGIASYDYAIGTTAGGTQVKNWTTVGTATSVTASSLALSDGTTYFVSVRANDTVGNTSTVATSNGVTVETTAPTPGTVNDGMGADIDWQSSTSTIQANWSGFSDATSGIASYDYAIGTTSGGTDISNWTSNAGATNVTNSSLGLADGTTYFVSVRANDTAGNTSTVATSNGVTVDTTAPTAGAVADGASTDVDWQTSTSSIQANWSGFSDSWPGIASYDYAIGTTAGGTQVKNWTSVGTATSVTASSLALSDGTTYFVSVRATDTAGNVSSVATSDGVTVDTTAPTPGTVNDGTTSDITWQNSTSTIQANWPGFSDATSGIASYDYAIGTTAGGTQVKNWTPVGTATSVTASSLALSDGTTYFVSVRATDTVGNTSTVATSNGVTVDATAPTPGTVNDGMGADIDWQTAAGFNANWSGFSDTDSGIAEYEYAIGTVTGGTDVQPWTSVGVATSASTTSATFVVGTVYYVSVRAVDGAGNVSAPSTSDGTEVRLIVTDGTVSGVDIQYQASTETFAADWTALAAGLGPDVVGFEWRIETSDYTPVTNWQTVGLATSASAAGLSLTPGGTYVARVGAVNQDTSVSPIAVSDGVTIDPYAPEIGRITIEQPSLNAADVIQSLAAPAGPEITATWSGFVDDISGIAGYSWAVGTSAGAHDITDWTDAGTLTHASFPPPSTRTYFVSVRATDRAGNSSVASSDPISPGAASSDPNSPGAAKDPNDAGRTDSALPFTGVDPLGALGIAALLIFAGAALRRTSTRRRTSN